MNLRLEIARMKGRLWVARMKLRGWRKREEHPDELAEANKAIAELQDIIKSAEKKH